MQEERLKIFEALTKKMSLGKTVDLEYFARKCEHFSGADIKALLYNAQLESIHEFTGKVLKGEDSGLLMPPNDGTRQQRGRSARQLRSQKILKVETVPPKVSTNKKIAHIPKLKDGPSPVMEEMEEKLSSQVREKWSLYKFWNLNMNFKILIFTVNCLAVSGLILFF